ncbi:amino acid ABC transporter ATP-binding protein [Holdemania massiliensis]|uniref:ATP-binding cassette domain-containing protein n=1 Tax=Holdemania massiliensis TaxID=1468449 RepID=A0A6N7S6P7_9FIRM|nr:amino acid ABC transporter ATP-binding protein [Holdemania massiliensis]MSA71235.1 ATP-binding cassette domain-containing protein [Holdemania massiliensis]MSA89561.1 ATP-binding cassette domain-containing protein [Holdemania massiliensis]MSB78315.1 ATP-binding cassette domain-containing protein [Holdemania massiliensis]MSC33239.1 ATP-binding cassette domain-containing protein [Holdemania massiliensis]MSC39706.1 ATP-binding cassette domain-containing protein [Holdemania massiliensis]
MLEVRNIHKSFADREVLKGVDLRVNKGDVVTILGRSGSGKTTFLRCINFLENADQGTMTLDQETFELAHVSCQDKIRIRRKTAFVFQNYNLFRNKTALENVTEGLIIARKMPKDQAVETAFQALEKVGLRDRAEAYPHQLSGGQQQRIGIARAIATQPELILFDEPTSALDPELIGEVLQVMKQLAQEGMTMLIVTHEMNFARQVSSQVLFMDEGVIVEQNPPDLFFDAPQQVQTQQFLKTLREH